MRSVHIDTGAFIALIWRRDRAHAVMREAFAELREQRTPLLTCDPVVGETATRLRYDVGLDATLAFHDLVEQAATVGQLEIVESSPQLRRAAFELMGRFDGLALSYADATGAAAARARDCDHVLGLDNDFRVLGFHLLPDGPAGPHGQHVPQHDP